MLRWTLLASVWLHMAGFVGVAVTSGDDPRGFVAPPTVLVERVWSGPGADGSGGRTGERPGPSDSEAHRPLEGPGQPGADPGLAVGPHAGILGVGGAAPGTAAPSPRAVDPRSRPPLAAPPRIATAEPPDLLEPPPPPEDDLQPYARTEADDAVADASDAPFVSAHTTRTADPTRTPVSSDRLGPLVPVSAGRGAGGGRPTPLRRAGVESASQGNRARPVARPVPITVGGAGSGAEGSGDGSGGAGVAGPRLAGGPAAPHGAGATGAAGGGGGMGSPPRAAPVALRGDRPRPDVSGWWRPLATRIEAEPPRVAVVARATLPANTQNQGVALVDAPRQQADLGGSGDSDEAEALPTPQVAMDPGVVPRVAPPGTADLVTELRDQLGFGPIDGDRLAPRPAWPGREATGGRADSAPQLVADLPVAWRAAVDTVGTPLGVWVAQAEARIEARWQTLDLEPHERAMGLQGQVTIRYVVSPGGRVSSPGVARSSGNPSIDRMAMDAIPARLPRLPRERRERSLHHEITLRYRNPLTATGSEPSPGAEARPEGGR